LRKHKAIDVKQAWSIKNYRYVCNVSTTEDNKNEDILGKGGAYKDWLRGHKASKKDLRCQASFLVLENTLKSVFADQEEASAKRDERKHRDRKEQMLSFIRHTK
jgi:hypothetical protein